MKNIKKIAVFLSAVILSSLVLSGCSNDNSSKKNNDSESSIEQSRSDNAGEKKTEQDNKDSSDEISANTESKTGENPKAQNQSITFVKPDFWGDEIGVYFSSSPWTEEYFGENVFLTEGSDQKFTEYGGLLMKKEKDGIYTFSEAELSVYEELYIYFSDGKFQYPLYDKTIKYEEGKSYEAEDESLDNYTYIDEVKFAVPDFLDIQDDSLHVEIKSNTVRDMVQDMDYGQMQKGDDGIYTFKVDDSFFDPKIRFNYQREGDYNVNYYPDTNAFYPDTDDGRDVFDYEKNKVYGGDSLYKINIKGAVAENNKYVGYGNCSIEAKDISVAVDICPDVEEFKFTKCEIGSDVISELCKIKSLKKLEFDSCTGINDLSALKSDTLSELKFTNCNITDEILKTADFSKCPKLKKIPDAG